MAQQREQAIPIDSHQFIDFMNLTYHREVAARLLANPEAVLSKARSNLQRWAKVHEGTGSAAALAEAEEDRMIGA